MAQKTQLARARRPTNARSTGTIASTANQFEVLRRCAQTCGETLNYCLEQGGDHADADHVIALVDCAEVCTIAANFVARDSELVASLLESCAEAAKRCEESCEEFEGDDTVTDCADVCRECYEACVNA